MADAEVLKVYGKEKYFYQDLNAQNEHFAARINERLEESEVSVTKGAGMVPRANAVGALQYDLVGNVTGNVTGNATSADHAETADLATHANNASEADFATDANRLENKHWVVAAEGQITIDNGAEGIINLGRPFYQHNFYLVSVDTPIQVDDVVIHSCDTGTTSFYYISRSPNHTDWLCIKNRHITMRDFCYKVLVWE